MEWIIFLVLVLIFGAGIYGLHRSSRKLDARDAALVGAGAPTSRTAPEAHPTTTRTAGAYEPRSNAEIIAAAGLGDFRTADAEGPASVSAVLSPAETYDRLMGAIHLLIVGETGSGKSVAANALLAGRAQSDLVCVIDPHATPADWGGVPAIGAGRTYAAIEAALGELLAEMSRRYDVRAKGQIDYQPLTIFVDELPAIMQHCATAKQFFGELVREARKVDMRLVCLTQSTRVKTLGIEGEGDVLENLMWLLLGEKATAASKDAAALERPAAIDHKGRIVPALTTALPMMAGRAVLPARVLHLSSVSAPPARVVVEADPAEDAMLLRLFDQVDAAKRAETAPKPFRTAETPISPVATPQNEDAAPFQNVDFGMLARLVRAGKIGETDCLKIALGVKPGSSAEYQAARDGLKKALQELDATA